MKKVKLHSPHCLFLFAWSLFLSCSGQSNSKVIENNPPGMVVTPNKNLQIADYVVAIFEDKKGNMWFGTVGEGVARFDGKTLSYLTKEDGLVDNTVASIAEDKAGNIWFGTHGGLARYDGKTITNFTTKNGLCNDRVANLLIDKTGNVWVGTWNGVCRYDGIGFTKFDLPIPNVDLFPYQNTMNLVTEIMEDLQGNIWFGRDGYGACKYHAAASSTGQASFTHFTKKDGLPSNNVQAIHEDQQGNIWFGCRVTENDSPDPNGRNGDGGLSRYDGKTMVQFPEIKGLSKNESYAIAGDKAGNVWIGANKVGVYKYDGKRFTLFDETDRKDLMPYGYGIQRILEDRKGALWLGLSGGLFRLDGSKIVNITQGGL